MSRSPLLPDTFSESTGRRLFCFPHAGGGTALFYRWSRYLPADIELAPVRLPGREDRLGEPPYLELPALADDIAGVLCELPPRPYVLLGHSLGGYVAFEVARRLQAAGYPPPDRLIVAACGAPRQGKAKHPIAHLPDERFLDEVHRRYNGIPDAVRNHPELLAMVLPALRADLQMIEAYDNPSHESLSADILALGGVDDVGVSAARLEAWRQLTNGQFSLRLMPGGHFFLHPPARRELGPGDNTTPAPLAAILATLPSAGETCE